MTKPFHKRLVNYYNSVAEELKAKSSKAKAFGNTTDSGMVKESAFADFLRAHVPKKCDLFFGGFLFGHDGSESKQLDVIVTTDTSPRYEFSNIQKSFSPVDGCLGVVSVKSNLDKTQLIDALGGFESIPNKQSLGGKINPLVKIPDYDDWPTKIIYASDGSTGDTILGHLADYYKSRPQIAYSQRPNYIYIVGKYLISRFKKGMTYQTSSVSLSSDDNVGQFYLIEHNPDLQAIGWILTDLQQRSVASGHINHEYGYLINAVLDAAVS